MRISSKCSMALHTLVLLAVFPDRRLTSEDIACSVGCNPVMIRNLLCKLKQAGLIETQRGTGGSSLCKAPEEISIWTVYQAVDKDSLDTLIGLHPRPYSQCPVGESIYALLETPYNNIKSAMQEAMETATLQQLIADYHARNQT